MIWQYFRLTATPFPVLPVAAQACVLPSWHEHLDQLQATLEQQQGPALILGSAGTGKTMLLAILAQRLAAQYRICHLRDGGLDNRLDFWKTLLFELGLPVPGADANDCRRALLSALRQQPEFAGDLLLLIDEAHTLSEDVLEQLRLLSNIVEQGHSRIQFVLAGNHPLEEQLLAPQLNSLNQRIHCRVYLAGMGLDELFGYIDFHWQRVGGQQHPFTDEAIRALHTATLGIPRLVHQLTEQALGFAAQQHLQVIDETSIQIAWSRWQHLPVPQLNRANQGAEPPAAATATAPVLEFGSLDDDLPIAAATRSEVAPAVSLQPEIALPDTDIQESAVVDRMDVTLGSANNSEMPAENSATTDDTLAAADAFSHEPSFASSENADSIASLVAAQQTAQSQTLIRFAFEADIQKPAPVPAASTAAPPVASIPAASAATPTGASASMPVPNQPVLPAATMASSAGPVRPPQPPAEVQSIGRSYQQWEAAFDTLEQALDRVQQPADAIEDLLIEADLQAIVNPIEILQQSASETRQLLSTAPAEVFQDHLYFETLWLQDTVWTQYIKDPEVSAPATNVDTVLPNTAALDTATSASSLTDDSTVSIPLTRLRIDSPTTSPTIASPAKPMHVNSQSAHPLGLTETPSRMEATAPDLSMPSGHFPPAAMEIRIDAQVGRQVNPPQRVERWETVRPIDAPAVTWSAAEVELGEAVRTSAVPFNDDAAIIHRQPEPRVSGGRETVIHSPQVMEPPAMARRKDLRALLHALRGY